MQTIAVPYFIGRFMEGFDVPAPDIVVTPNLPETDVPYDPSHTSGPRDLPQRRMSALFEHVAGAIAAPATVYAGDCLAVIGVIAGLQRGGVNPVLYWFDAHGDFHTWETTRSNFLGGMPLAMITGRGEQTIVDATAMSPLGDDRIVLVDARDLDPGEDAAVAASDVTVASVDEVAAAEPRSGPILVHIDVDVVDPSDLPAVNYPAPGGPSLSTVLAALQRLAATRRVVAISISGWNPQLPAADRAAAVTRRLTDVFASA